MTPTNLPLPYPENGLPNRPGSAQTRATPPAAVVWVPRPLLRTVFCRPAGWSLIPLTALAGLVLVESFTHGWGRLDDWRLPIGFLAWPRHWQVATAMMGMGAMLAACRAAITVLRGLSTIGQRQYGRTVIAVLLLMAHLPLIVPLIATAMTVPADAAPDPNDPRNDENRNWEGKDPDGYRAVRARVAAGWNPTGIRHARDGIFDGHDFGAAAIPLAGQPIAVEAGALRSTHPLTGSSEVFLGVLVGGGPAPAATTRQPLDLIILLDRSGSMGGPGCARPIVDPHAPPHPFAAVAPQLPSKHQLARIAARQIITRLDPGDRLGVVIFNHRVEVAKPLRQVASTDLAAIVRHLEDLPSLGGSCADDGLRIALSMLETDGTGHRDPSRERRIVMLTDLLPLRDHRPDEPTPRPWFEMAAAAAAKGVHTTFIGIGAGIDAPAYEEIARIPGANAVSISSPAEAKAWLGEGLVSWSRPAARNLRVHLRSADFAIDSTVGARGTDAPAGQLLAVGGVFPAGFGPAGMRSGMALIRLRALRPTPPDAILPLDVEYVDPRGERHTRRLRVPVTTEERHRAESLNALPKAILLARTTDLLLDVPATVRPFRPRPTSDRPGEPELADADEPVAPPAPLEVDPRARRFVAHFDAEAARLGDPSLHADRWLLSRLVDPPPETPGNRGLTRPPPKRAADRCIMASCERQVQ